MKKLYSRKRKKFSLFKERSYNPEDVYADVTVLGFGSVIGEETIEPNDKW